MFFGFNYIDLILFLILGYHIWKGIELGFWVLFARLASFVISLISAFTLYQPIGLYISERSDVFPSFVFALSFVILFIVIQGLLHSFMAIFLNRLPTSWHQHGFNKSLGILPALIDAGIVIMLLVLIVVILPFPGHIKQDVENSNMGEYVLEALPVFEERLRNVFGGALDEALTYLTIRPETEETILIPHRPRVLLIDSESEVKMLELINEERLLAGLSPLVMDEELVEVARDHSSDMWERGYFSHVNPDGDDPFQRMRDGGIRFLSAGENLALAPTVGFAHRGLMNSPGHRANILNPSFGKVGIGVISGSPYGKMFTQKFTN